MKKFLFSIFALAMALTVNASENIKVYMTLDKKLEAGGTATLTVHESDVDEFIGYEMKFLLPEGVSFATNKRGNPDFKLNTERFDAEDGWMNSIIKYNSDTKKTNIMNQYSWYNIEDDDVLYTIVLQADETFKGGEIGMSEVIFAVSSKVYFEPSVASISTDATGVETVAADNTKDITKTVENNQVVIKKNGKKWNAAGGQMK